MLQSKIAPRGKTVLALLIPVVLFFILSYYISPFVPDNSYISFRYAQNMGNGLGITFNPS